MSSKDTKFVDLKIIYVSLYQSGPDTGVDNLHKVEGPGPLGGPGGPGPPKGRRRRVKEKGEKGEKKGKKGEKEKRKREKE